jgi:GntR family transcriptional regulator/MocR family aminotransferase
VSRSRARNAARRGALLEAIREHLGGAAEVTGADAGLHVLVWLRGVPGSRLPALVRAAEELGVGVYPVTPHCSAPPRDAGLVLGYASLAERSIREGIQRLARVIPQSAR